MREPLRLSPVNALILEETCGVCAGDGVITPLEWQSWNETYNMMQVGKMTPDEMKAWLVDHPYPTSPEQKSCLKCHGTGFQLTLTGEAILQLVREHGKA